MILYLLGRLSVGGSRFRSWRQILSLTQWLTSFTHDDSEQQVKVDVECVFQASTASFFAISDHKKGFLPCCPSCSKLVVSTCLLSYFRGYSRFSIVKTVLLVIQERLADFVMDDRCIWLVC